MRFDFEATPSRNHNDALRDRQKVLRPGDAEEAKRLWSRLVAIADANRAGGSLDLAGLFAELRGEFDLRDHPDYRRDWEVLDRSSRELMADIRSQISGLAPLPRDEDRAKVPRLPRPGPSLLSRRRVRKREVRLGQQIGEGD